MSHSAMGEPCNMHVNMIRILFMIVLTLCGTFASSGVNNYTVVGDINIGGLFPLHYYNETTGTCGLIRSIRSLKKVEAMMYAIEQVNQDPTLLPNITLGFEIYDTCSDDSHTLGECLNFISSERNTCTMPDCCTGTQNDRLPIVGVVGAQRSSSSIQAALLLGLHHIPLISYLSTSDELSNNRRYPYFLRTVGPDRFQVEAMIDILLYHNWNYVSFLYSDDAYGVSAEQVFRSTTPAGICVGLTRKVSRFDTQDKYKNIISDLLDVQHVQRGTNATVVILFLHLEMAQNLFSAVTRLNGTRKFIWIGSDGWGTYGEEVTRGNEEAALGSFTLVPASKILPEFNQYFRSIKPTTSDNPWLPEFLEHICSNIGAGINCDNIGLIESVDSNTSSHETLVMDSVFAFAHALDSSYRSLCPNTTAGMCPEMKHGDHLLHELLKTNFTSLANGHVSFMSQGDLSGRYSIRYLKQFDDGSYKFVPIGKWDRNEDRHISFEQEIPWYLSSVQSTGVPKSVCSEPCGIGKRINVYVINPCCWTCSPCRNNEIVVSNNTECRSCIDKHNRTYAWPNDNSTVCVPLLPDENSWRIWSTLISVFGVLVTIVAIVLYTRNHENALIKASGRELSCLMFIGILLAYTSAILWVQYPTQGICMSIRLFSPIATSLIYVALAMKTCRLYRIFRVGVKRPKLISPKSQIALTLAITSIPLIWTSTWMAIDSTQIYKDMPYADQPLLQIQCSTRTRSSASAIGVIVWNIVVVLVCLILAFLIRKLPQNYNESRFITFCAFCSLVVFMVFSFISVSDKIIPEAHHRAGLSSLELIVNATGTLCCLFIVKLYAVYFVKLEKWNIRKLSSVMGPGTSPRAKTKDDGFPYPKMQEPDRGTKTGIENAGFSHDLKLPDLDTNEGLHKKVPSDSRLPPNSQGGVPECHLPTLCEVNVSNDKQLINMGVDSAVSSADRSLDYPDMNSSAGNENVNSKIVKDSNELESTQHNNNNSDSNLDTDSTDL